MSEPKVKTICGVRERGTTESATTGWNAEKQE